ncbi:Arylsulfatase [Pontiella desulfatans]|uniref:Arylsulfatase n=2 Tax=Pontiella desulfatans TaxID=2750659 RepID=A0A6C2TY09_PONDE|nr:sulfatase S1_11 [Kiritimatiellales bacterium]VGO12479.1 Arylsulfatase [Pontiella desulfatans]
MMKMKNLVLLSVLLAGSCLGGKPNILFVMSDDHTSQAIGVYGGRLQKLNPTPTIDSIAHEGMVMENAFCQNAICTPSRAAIMTGQSAAVNGCITLNEKLPPERQYLSLEMKKAGYQTAIVGKWHLKERPSTFDYYKVLPGQGDFFDPIFYETGATETQSRQYSNKQGGWTQKFEGAVRMKGHSSDCIADSALEWFKTKRDPNKPFFLKLHFKAPHDMFEYAPRYESYLADVEIPEPDNMRDRKNHGSIATRGHNDELVPYIGTSIGRRNPRRNYTKSGMWAKDLDQSKSDDEIIADAYQGYMKAYLRCVKGVDDNLKRVVDYLKAEGLYDNTVIMYTGDQGFWLGEHDYMDKRWAYEESMRMPFIVRYPKSVKNGRSEAIVENIDYAPTMLDFAGVATPDYMHGQSFKTVLETGKEPADAKQAAYYHYWMHMAHHDNPAHIAIRTKRYKLILFYGAGWKGETEPDTPPGWELYDLKNDPTEDNNVYDNPEYAGVIETLKEQLKARRAELGEDDPKFALNQVIDEYWNYDNEARAKAIKISHAMRAKKEGR